MRTYFIDDDQDGVDIEQAARAFVDGTADQDQVEAVRWSIEGFIEDAWRFGGLGAMFGHDANLFRATIALAPIQDMFWKES
jgi:hypothetical protein